MKVLADKEKKTMNRKASYRANSVLRLRSSLTTDDNTPVRPKLPAAEIPDAKMPLEGAICVSGSKVSVNLFHSHIRPW